MTAFRKERLQGLSCLKGNFHEQFLGGWAGAILPGYPAHAIPVRVNGPYSTQRPPPIMEKGVRDLVMELCCALHNFRVRLSPWQPMI